MSLPSKVETAMSDKTLTDGTDVCVKEDGDVNVKHEWDNDNGLLYGVTETPPFGILLSTAIQNILLCLGVALSMTYVINDVICAGQDHPIRARLLCSTLMMIGVSTILQSMIGTRLPIFQGASGVFIMPLIAMKTNPAWQCKPRDSIGMGNDSSNVTDMGNDVADAEMYIKLREMMGSLMAASVFEVLVGATGLAGLLLNYIGPLTIATVISLIGLGLVKIPIGYVRVHWGVSGASILVCVVMILYLGKVRVPCLIGCRRTNGASPCMRMPVFQMFAVLFSVMVAWLLSYILTITGALSDDPEALEFRARSDVRTNLIKETQWFYVPYPGQFGTPLFNVTLFTGYISAFLASILESIGDYCAAAAISDVPSPPRHAVNRGIMSEGLASVLSGAVGTGHATTSYTTNLALIGISRIASRNALTLAGLICIVISWIGKLGAVMVSIPDPCLGGATFTIFGMICAVGIFSLRNVDMKSSRNIAIFGISLYAGIVIPRWLEEYPDGLGEDTATGIGALKGLLSQPMLVGGLVAFILDNTVAGTLKERGLHQRRLEHSQTGVDSPATALELERVYTIRSLNWLLRKLPCIQRLPVFPTLVDVEPEEKDTVAAADFTHF